jgi:WD40 repeat protein
VTSRSYSLKQIISDVALLSFQTKSKNKKKDFQAFYLNQTLTDPLNGLLDVTPDPVLNMKFSQDGSYLATASKGGIIRIWQLSPDSYSMDELFVTKPIREFTSHKAAVLDLSWSKVGHGVQLKRASSWIWLQQVN